METGEGRRRGSRSFPRSACAYPLNRVVLAGRATMPHSDVSKVIVRMVCATSSISRGFRGCPLPHSPPVHAGTPHGSERAGTAAAAPARVRVHRPHRSFSTTAGGEFSTLQLAVIPGWQAGAPGPRRSEADQFPAATPVPRGHPAASPRDEQTLLPTRIPKALKVLPSIKYQKQSLPLTPARIVD